MGNVVSFKKTIFASLLCIIFALLGFVLVGCGDKYANMTLTLSKQAVEIQLVDGVSSEETIEATIQGDVSISREVVVNCESPMINYRTVMNSDKKTIITLTASAPCENQLITIRSVEGNKTASFVVSVVVPVKTISATTENKDLFVVKGEKKSLAVSDLIVFEPQNTTQKDISFSIKTQPAGAEIKHNVLTVAEDYPYDTIEIEAVSPKLGGEGVTLVLDVLAKDAVSFESIVYTKDTTNPSLIGTGNVLPSTIKMTSNLEVWKFVEFTLHINSSQKFTISPIIESTNSFSSNNLWFNTGNLKTITGTGDSVLTEYTILLNCGDNVSTDRVFFKIEYDDYNYSYPTTSFGVKVEEYVKDIETYINGTLSSNTSLTVYDKYKDGKGLQLSFEALPTKLSADDRTLILTLGNNAQNFYFKDSQLKILNDETNSAVVDNKIEIKSGDVIYISAKDGKSQASFTISSKNNPLKQKQFNLQAKPGTESISFINSADTIDELNGDKSYIYYISSNQPTAQTLKFVTDVMDVMSVASLDVEKSGDTITIESKPVANLDCYSFVIKSIKGAEGTTVITVKQENGYYAKAYIRTIYQLQQDEVVFSVPSSQTNASVGYMERQNGANWQFKAGIKKDHAVTLTREGKGVDQVKYSYNEILKSDEASDYETFFNSANFEEMNFRSASAPDYFEPMVIDDTYLELNQLLVTSVGKLVVKAEVFGSEVVENKGVFKLESKSFVTYFCVEGYVPVENYKLSQSVVNLYAKSSVGYDNLDLTKAKVQLLLNGDATYQNISWLDVADQKQENGKLIYKTTLENNNKDLTIEALSTWAEVDGVMVEKDVLSFTFQVVIKEFANTEYRLALTVNIFKAQKVEKIIVENVNVNNGLYIPLTYGGKSIIRTIDASFQVGESGKLPFNTDLIFEFLPNVSMATNVVSLNKRTGNLIISSGAERGGIGTIRIAPADRYDENNLFVDDGSGVAVYIDVVIADGQTRETSYRITKLDDLDAYASTSLPKNKMHFTLMNDIIISTDSGFALFDNFAGGMYGAIEGATNFATIKTNKTLFGELAENALVCDLIVCGEVEANAFVANTNNGTIKNVSIEAIEGEQKQYASPSVLTANAENVGGVCAVNNGIVNNCLFSGQIISNNAFANVGGIVGLNTNKVVNCATEFYSYAKLVEGEKQKSVGSITATGNVGGIVGKMVDGSLENSYAKSYTTTDETLILGTTVGALIGDLSKGKVDISFADVKGQSSLFGKRSAEGIVKNVYILFENTGIYFVDGAQKTLEDAKTKITTNDVWQFNSETDDYPTFKNVKAPNPATEIGETFVESNKTISAVEEVGGKKISQAIMFYYDVSDSLSLQETFALDDLNFVSYNDLFGENAFGIRAISSNSQIIATSATGLNLKGVGEVNLTFYSKYNADLTKDFVVYVINPVENLKFNSGSLMFENNSIVNAKTTQGFSFVAKIDNSILLDDRYVNYSTNSFKIEISRLMEESVDETTQQKIKTEKPNYQNYFSGDNMGPINVATQNLIGKNYVSYYLQLLDSDFDNEVTKLLKTRFFGEFVINVYQGADSVELNTSSVAIEPIDEVELKVVVLTDDKNDNLSITLAPNANFDGEIFEINKSCEVEYFLDKDCVLSCDKTDAKYFKMIYTVNFEIKDDFKNYNFENTPFFFTINATSAEHNTKFYGTESLAKLFVVNVSNQQIISASVSHFKNTEKTIVKDETTNNNFVLYHYETTLTDSTLEPGKEGLLKIDLYPTYAKYDYITVTYSTLGDKNFKMYLSSMVEHKIGEETVGFRQSVKNVTDLENGIKISVGEIDNFEDLSTIYLGTYIPISIEEDVVFVLKFSAFNNNELVKETEFNIIVEYTSGAILTVEDNLGNKLTATTPGSEQILKVTIPKANSTKLAYQPSVFGVKSSTNPDANWQLTLLQIIEDDYSLTRTFKYSLSFGQYIELEDNTNYITLEATLTWMINGKPQYKTTTYTLAVVDFLINNIQLKTTRTDKTTFFSYIGIESTLQFEFSGLNTVEGDYENEAFNEFLKNCYYEDLAENENGNYIVNVGNRGAQTFLRNLYYVNGTLITPICDDFGNYNTNTYFSFTERDGKIFITGKQQGEITLRFILQTQLPSKSDRLLTEKYFDFTFVVSPYSDEDLPLIIDNEDAFWQAIEGTIAHDYILMKDLYLENVSPSNTRYINSLDGNNHTIHILSWNTDTQSSNLGIALFNTVNENTTLKNLTINVYHATNIRVDTNVVSNLNVAGLAITNEGVIYNCEVVAYKSVENLATQTSAGINITYSTDQIANNISSTVAGFVITNNGYITNSRVGGTILEKTDGKIQNLGSFNIIAQGNISGFVDTNSGTISSCFFNNATLTNTLASGKQTATSGFARINHTKITGSYAKGVGAQAYAVIGQGITTSSVGAGFVYSNIGSVSNCYSNILLATLTNSYMQTYESGRLSAGFVYNNAGNIEACYSASKIEEAKSTQMAFIGVDDEGDLLNSGKIKYSYYFADESIEGDAYSNSTANLNVVRISNPTLQDNFYGFSFAQNEIDGVWETNGFGLDLVSANQIAVSKRYIANVREDAITHEIQSYNLPYLEGYEYGSAKNPIIIRTAQEYNTVFGGNEGHVGSAISSYYSASGKYVFGNYRIICDINLQELNPDSSQNINISSTQMDLRGGVIDGNMMTISGIDLTANTESISNNFGLFAKISENGCVKNLTLNVVNISAKKVRFVGALAGSVENAKAINIVVQRQNLTQTATVLGNNVVGGLVGFASGESEIKAIVVDSVVLKANALAVGENQTYVRTAKDSQFANLAISYAGGVIGVADVYNFADKTNYEHSTDSKVAQLSYLIVKGDMQVRASTAGGVVGFLGPQTTLRDTTFQTTQNSLSKIIAYNFYAGGVVGECRGNIDMARAEHDEITQKQIEDNVSAYYKNPSATIERGNMALFEDVSDGEVISTYEPIAIGGLVGLLYTGEIQHSYSKVNVKNSLVQYAGGIVGQIAGHNEPKLSRNELTLFEVYAFGDVGTDKNITEDKKYAVGGIAGFIDSGRKVSMAKVNAVNYWSVVFNENENAFELPENVYQIYAMTNATQNTILELKDVVKKEAEGESYSFKNNSYRLPAISFTAVNDAMFAITEVKLNNKGKVESKFVQQSFASTTLGGLDVFLMVVDPNYGKQDSEKIITTGEYVNTQAVIPYYDLDNIEMNGAKMDTYFIQAGWDTNYWVRYTETNDLLPSLVTYTGSMTYYIDVESDIQKMLYHPYATFIVRAFEQPLVNNKHLVKIGNYIKRTGIILPNFSGTLKGLDNTQNYGFDFQNQTSFIAQTTGANFKNLTMMNLGRNGGDITEINQAFIDEATLTSFENMLFEECYSTTKISEDNLDVGLLANKMKGGFLADISMLNCAINAEFGNDENEFMPTESTEVNIGLVCGKVEGLGNATLQIQDVCVYQTPKQTFRADKVKNTINVQLGENVNSDKIELNVGAVIGQTVGKIVTSYSSKSSTGDLIKGLGIATSVNNALYTVSQDGEDRGTTIAITGQGEIEKANVGMLYGKTGNSTISYSRTSTLHTLNIVGNFTCKGPTITETNFGGIVGLSTSNLAISSVATTSNKFVIVDVNMDIETQNVNAGMIAGKVGSTYTINNIDTYGTIEVSALTENSTQNIGGFIGEAINDLTISNAISRTTIKFIGEKTTANLGGFIGLYHKGSLNLGATEEKTKFLGTIIFDADTVYCGGLVGALGAKSDNEVVGAQKTYANINNAVFGGKISMSKNANSTGKIYAGGLIGESSNSQIASIANAISYGEINLLTNIARIKENDEQILVYLGGLLGCGNSGTTLSNNVSVSTVASKTSVTLKDVNINALVGDANGASGANNFYSHQVSLCLDLNDENIGATNQYYPELSNNNFVVGEETYSLKLNLERYISTLTSIEEKNEEWQLGTKLHPYVVKDNETWESETAKLSNPENVKTKHFVVVSRGIEQNALHFESEIAPKDIVNAQIVGNGTKIYSNNALFGTVDELSAVSGLVVKPNSKDAPATFDAELNTDGVGTIANINHGYVFACTVISDGIDAYNNYEFTAPGSFISGGLIGASDGVVMDCMTSINILGNGVTAGLVGFNKGIIVSSYTVGKIENGYAFSNGEGEVYGSYTASSTTDGKGVFGQNAVVEDSFFDIYAVGCVDDRENETKSVASTNKVSILETNKNGESDIISIHSLFSVNTNNNKKFAFEDGKNFGYPTFSGVAYSTLVDEDGEDCNYMSGILTGDGREKPIMINSVGKLQQISSAQEGNKDLSYKLIYDIDLTDAMKTTAGNNNNIFAITSTFEVANWRPISGFNGKFDGEWTKGTEKGKHKISNLTTTKTDDWAVFNVVGENALNQVEIKNTEFKFGTLEINAKNLSTVAISVANTNLTNLTITAGTIKTSSSGAQNLSGLVGTATASKIENITMNISSLQGGLFIGGLIANAGEESGTKDTTISNVTFEKTITITVTQTGANAGGLFGNVGGNVNVLKATLKGVTIKTQGTSSQAIGFTAGGVAGVAKGLDISKIQLDGKISLEANTSVSDPVVFGGIVGVGSGTKTNLNSNNITFASDEVSEIKITQSGKGNIIGGGVAGILEEGAMAQHLQVKPTLSTIDETPVTFGGIVGETSGTYDLTAIDLSAVKINKDTYSFGNVTFNLQSNSTDADKKVNKKENYIGGIVGKLGAGIVNAEDSKLGGDFEYTVQADTRIGAVAGLISGGKVYHLTLGANIKLTGVNIGAVAGVIQSGALDKVVVEKAEITGLYNGKTADVGGIASIIGGANNTTLEDVNVLAGVKIKTELIDATADTTKDENNNKVKNTEATTNIGGFAGTFEAYVGSKSTSSANITLQTPGNAGGIAGTMKGTSTGENSYQVKHLLVAEVNVVADIDVDDLDKFEGEVNVGGIAGTLTGAELDGCSFVNGSVTANVPAYIGGIAGKASGKLSRAIVSGNIYQDFDEGYADQPSSISSAVGGLVGNASSVTINNSFVGIKDLPDSLKPEGYIFDCEVNGPYIAGGLVGTGSVKEINTCKNGATVLAGNVGFSQSTYVNPTTGEAVTQEKFKNWEVSYAGGIAGKLEGGTISGDTQNIGEVKSGTASNKIGDYPKTAFAGGFIGASSGVDITGGKNTGSVMAGFGGELDQKDKINARDLLWWDGTNDDEVEPYKTALKQKIDNKRDRINQSLTGSDVSYAGGIVGAISSGKIAEPVQNSGRVDADAKTLLTLNRSERFENDTGAGYDAYCYYGKEDCQAYATGVAYMPSDSTAIVNGTNKIISPSGLESGGNGNINSSGRKIEFNMFSTDNYHGAFDNKNIYYSYILDNGFEKIVTSTPDPFNPELSNTSTSYTYWNSFASLYEPDEKFVPDRYEDYQAWLKAQNEGKLTIVGAQTLVDYDKDADGNLEYTFGNLKFHKETSNPYYPDIPDRTDIYNQCYLKNDEYNLILGPVDCGKKYKIEDTYFSVIYSIPHVEAQRGSDEDMTWKGSGYYWKPSSDGKSCTKVNVWLTPGQNIHTATAESDLIWTDGSYIWTGYNGNAVPIYMNIDVNCHGPSYVETKAIDSNVFAYETTNNSAINYDKFWTVGSGTETTKIENKTISKTKYSFVKEQLKTIDLTTISLVRNASELDLYASSIIPGTYNIASVDTLLEMRGIAGFKPDTFEDIINTDPTEGQSVWGEVGSIIQIGDRTFTATESDVGNAIWYGVSNGVTLALHWKNGFLYYDNTKLLPKNSEYNEGDRFRLHDAGYTHINYVTIHRYVG